jgi:hypothetical protein
MAFVRARSGRLFMRPNILGDLLTTLDVRLHAFASANPDGLHLSFDAYGTAVLVHYVLAGPLASCINRATHLSSSGR